MSLKYEPSSEPQVNQWEVFDACVEDIEKQETEGALGAQGAMRNRKRGW